MAVKETDQMITVTSPLLPPLEDFIPYLQKIWDSKWITNNGVMHQQLEQALCHYLGVEYISLFSNGTLALMTALQALGIKGEVITTPYSFVATTHALWWNGIKPVFVDIDPVTCNMDPCKIEAAISPETTAIMPVHVYGTPCDVDKIQQIADRHGLKVVYDAAHAFAVKREEHSILQDGDLSVLSFHATKTYSTIEGGAIVCHTPEMKHHIDNLKNFGFRDETVVEEPGINAKLNEVQAAFGLAALKLIDHAIAQRQSWVHLYRELLSDLDGITFLKEQRNVTYNYSYFPIFINPELYGMNRDQLYQKLKDHGIFGRRYFYPLISNFNPYRQLPSSDIGNLPVANQMADSVICLPLHHQLCDQDVKKIAGLIKNSAL